MIQQLLVQVEQAVYESHPTFLYGSVIELHIQQQSQVKIWMTLTNTQHNYVSLEECDKQCAPYLCFTGVCC